MEQPTASAGTLIQRTPCVWRAEAIDLVPAPPSPMLLTDRTPARQSRFNAIAACHSARPPPTAAVEDQASGKKKIKSPCPEFRNSSSNHT
jgi:hypothetical protein